MSILKNLPSALLASDAVQFSVKTYLALATGDVSAFLRLHARADWRQQCLMIMKLSKAGTLVCCS